MAGIGGGAQTSFAPGGQMVTRHSAGDQYSSLGGGGGYNPLELVKNLRSEKERARREQMEWDASFARRQQQKDTALSAAPPDPYSEAMTQARIQGDTADYLQRRKEAGVERTRQDMVNRTLSDPRGGGVSTMGSFQSFGHQLPAAAMHGVDLMQGRGTGWDQYAALADAGAIPGAYGKEGRLS